MEGDRAIGAIGVDAVSVRLLVTHDDAKRARALLDKGTFDDADLQAPGVEAADPEDLDEDRSQREWPSSAAAAAASSGVSSARPLAAALALTALCLAVALVALVNVQRNSATRKPDSAAGLFIETRVFVAP